VVPLCSLVASLSANDLAPAPPEFRRLIDAGRVDIRFYDREAPPGPHPGRAEFDVLLNHDYKFQFRHSGARPAARTTITLTQQRICCHPVHRVYLPKSVETEDRWNDSLMRHEFDHVAVSSDPRVSLLLKHLVRSMGTIETRPGEMPLSDRTRIQQLINQECSKRTRALVDLVQANQHLLDEITEHGMRPLPDRETFFKSLYTAPNLHKAGFPYLCQVAGLLNSPGYQTAELLHLPD
jgi:hypothetical protein